MRADEYSEERVTSDGLAIPIGRRHLHDASAGEPGARAVAEVNTVIDAFVANHYAFHPHRAIWDGRHALDGRIPDFSASAIAERIAALERWRARLRALRPRAGFNPAHQDAGPSFETTALRSQVARDLAMAEHACAEELFRWREWRQHERNPGFYHGILDVSIYVKRPYAPAADRLEALTRHLRGVPAVLAAARANLRESASRPTLEQSVFAFRELADYYRNQLRAAGAAMAPTPARQQAFHEAIGIASGAVQEFVASLRERLGQATGNFRVGPAALAAMLLHGELVDLPLERLRAVGLDDLELNQARASEIAGRHGLTPLEAFDRLTQDRYQAHEVLTTATRVVAELRAVLAESGMVAMPDAALCHVVATPSFMRAGAAFMDAPGPFETPGQPAYFYITLPDPDWPATVQADWLAKLNPWGLRNTAAHETYPGHLLHFLRVGRHPADVARAFTSYACVEGWAHYAEQLILEAGYGAGDDWAELAQVGMAVLRDCRYLATLDLHAGSTTIPEAAAFIEARTHLAPIRCQQEAARCAQDPGSLYYALGKLMVLKLRADYQREAGTEYSPRRFHDALLACGAPPVPLARRMLLRDPTGDPV